MCVNGVIHNMDTHVGEEKPTETDLLTKLFSKAKILKGILISVSFPKAYFNDDFDSLMMLLEKPALKLLATRAFNMWRHWKSGYRFMKKDTEGKERNLKKV